jgi:hypothetical protein
VEPVAVQFVFDKRYSLYSRVERMKEKTDSQRDPGHRQPTSWRS